MSFHDDKVLLQNTLIIIVERDERERLGAWERSTRREEELSPEFVGARPWVGERGRNGIEERGSKWGGKMGEALTYWPFNEFLKFKMAPLCFEFSFWPTTQISFSHFNPQIFKFWPQSFEIFQNGPNFPEMSIWTLLLKVSLHTGP